MRLEDSKQSAILHRVAKEIGYDTIQQEGRYFVDIVIKSGQKTSYARLTVTHEQISYKNIEHNFKHILMLLLFMFPR